MLTQLIDCHSQKTRNKKGPAPFPYKHLFSSTFIRPHSDFQPSISSQIFQLLRASPPHSLTPRPTNQHPHLTQHSANLVAEVTAFVFKSHSAAVFLKSMSSQAAQCKNSEKSFAAGSVFFLVYSHNSPQVG